MHALSSVRLGIGTRPEMFSYLRRLTRSLGERDLERQSNRSAGVIRRREATILSIIRMAPPFNAI